MKRFLGWAIRAMIVGGVTSAACGKDDPVIVPPLKEIEALPIVRTVAEQEKVPFGHIMAPSDGAGFQSGDSVTALVSLTKGAELSQWLVQMTCTDLNEKELKRPPPAVHHMYTSAGTDIAFGGKFAVIAIRVLGPYKKTEKPGNARKEAKDLNVRAMVNSDSLALGFDRGCEAVLMLKQAHDSADKDGQFSWSSANKPFSAETTKENRAAIEKFGLTLERERALVGSVPALLEFWELASRTPGLQDLVKAVVDVPWFSIAMKGGQVNAGIGIDFSSVSSTALTNGNGKTDRQSYGFPVTLKINDKPALSCNLRVTSSRPPLITCAGIIALAAQAPDGKGAHLMIQIIDARSAGAGLTPSN